jgi:hypothetical protein
LQVEQFQASLRQAQGRPLRQAAGDLVSLRLEAGGPQPAVFTVTRAEDGFCAETAVGPAGSEPQRRVTRMEPPSDTQLLCGELAVRGRDPVYEDALRLTGEVARRLEAAQR